MAHKQSKTRFSACSCIQYIYIWGCFRRNCEWIALLSKECIAGLIKTDDEKLLVVGSVLEIKDVPHEVVTQLTGSVDQLFGANSVQFMEGRATEYILGRQVIDPEASKLVGKVVIINEITTNARGEANLHLEPLTIASRTWRSNLIIETLFVIAPSFVQ